MEAKLIDPPIANDYASRMRPFPWSELPEPLKDRFSRKTPMYILTEPVTVEWDNYNWTVKAGFIWDGASIPLVLAPISSRFTSGFELFPASLLHDAGWRGDAPWLHHSWRKSLIRYTRLYEALGVAAGYPRWRMRWHRRILFIAAYMRRFPGLGWPDPSLIEVAPVGPNLPHKYSLDWKLYTSGSA